MFFKDGVKEVPAKFGIPGQENAELMLEPKILKFRLRSGNPLRCPSRNL